MNHKKMVEVFFSFEEENSIEYSRRKKMSPEDRIREFYEIQCRRWGKDWQKIPIRKVVSFEEVSW